MTEGTWADYRFLTISGGRTSEDLLRVQCVGKSRSGDWTVEMLPLRETDAGLEVRPGEGLSLVLSARLLERQAELSDVIIEAVRWREGVAHPMPPAEWREDPLVAPSLKGEFEPDAVEMTGTTIRVVGRQELRCEQYLLTAADTLQVTLPRGLLEQVSQREITAAVNPGIPFLGLAFATERTSSVTRLDPPSDRFPPPPPTLKVETMELVAFGENARARLLRH